MVKVTISADGIGNALTARIPSASRQVQEAVIASCEPFVPYRTGELCRSAVPAGSGADGMVIYTAPHAALCYYAERPFSKKVHPQACARWFEAAKAADLAKWIAAAASALTDDRAGRRG
ncbi:MAG: hypothetical protein IJP32_08450 [Clostridia bacterium]|nr:hypothetical protein [Clostridia bacterium]MBQ9996386.1 hypothetical protein [Clostridia bacterium]